MWAVVRRWNHATRLVCDKLEADRRGKQINIQGSQDMEHTEKKSWQHYIRICHLMMFGRSLPKFASI